MLKVSTFCSGIGSPEQALKNLGIEHKTVFACEIDKYARQSYLANHECETMYHDMTKEDYVGEHWYSDINISGIPCQAFSLAGKRLGELDPRGLLFFDFYRYVKNQKPKYFIIENVKGLLSDNNGATFQNWINLLGQSVNGDAFMFPHEDSIMYNLHWQVLNTKDYGLPQNRERVFLIGIRNDLPNTFVFPKKIPLELRLKDVLEYEVDEKYYLSKKMLELLTYEKKGSTEIANINKGGQKGSVISEDSTHVGCLSVTDYKLPKLIQVQSATASGYEIATDGDSINLEHPNSETRRGRVGKQVAQTLTTSCNQGVMVSNEVIQINPSTESGGVQPYQQNRVYDSEGIAPALCRGKSDLNITETYDYPRVKYQLTGGKWDKTHEQSGRVYDENGIAPTIHTMGGGNQEPKTFDNYRIRKLTPLETFRLQGFSDEFVQKAVDVGVSNSQLYKQAGNSISVPVIQAILKNLLT